MAYRICENLVKKNWSSYADDLDKAPLNAEGIYAIGVERAGDVRYLYVGHTRNIRRRLQEHRRLNQTLKIDQFVQKTLRERNAAKTLRIKWVEERSNKRAEEKYLLECLGKKIGYWPEYNRKAWCKGK